MPPLVVKQHDGAGYLISVYSYDTGGLRRSGQVIEYKGRVTQRPSGKASGSKGGREEGREERE